MRPHNIGGIEYLHQNVEIEKVKRGLQNPPFAGLPPLQHLQDTFQMFIVTREVVLRQPLAVFGKSRASTEPVIVRQRENALLRLFGIHRMDQIPQR